MQKKKNILDDALLPWRFYQENIHALFNNFPANTFGIREFFMYASLIYLDTQDFNRHNDYYKV